MRSAMLLLLFATVARADRIDAQMRLIPLVAANQSYRHLGLDATELGLFNLRARQEVSWQENREFVHSQIDDSAKRLHDQFCFQYMVGKGMVEHAIRFAGVDLIEEQTEDLRKQLSKLKLEAESLVRSDRCQMAEELFHLGTGKELDLGEPYRFLSKSLARSYGWEESDINPIPLKLLTSSHVRAELKLSILQINQLKNVHDQWVQKEPSIACSSRVDMDFDFPEESFEGIPADSVRIEKEMYADVDAILTDDQKTRFGQIYMQFYLRSFQLDPVWHYLGVEFKETKKTRRLLSKTRRSDELVAKQLRSFQVFLPLVLEYVPEAKVNQLTQKRFVPHAVFGEPTDLAYKVLRSLADASKPTIKNPRRENDGR